MSAPPVPPAGRGDRYGDSLPSLLYHGLRERLHGERPRARARWGYVRPPGERGRLVWLATGADPGRVRLAVELTQAIRQKRLDVRLVLTFEEDYPELLRPLEGLDRVGWGFGPCDHPRALARAFARLAPFGLISVGPPRPGLAAAAARLPHALLVAAAPAPGGPAFEWIYPADQAQALAAAGQPGVAPAVDLNALLAQAQVDPNFASLVNGGRERALWWLHAANDAAAAQAAAAFKAWGGADVLFVTLARAAPPPAAPWEDVAISAWGREPLPERGVVRVDDWKWLPAVAAAVTACHLQVIGDPPLWQALAGGAAVSVGNAAALPKPELAAAVTEVRDTAALLRLWQGYREGPSAARRRGDDARRAFWEERRLALRVKDELLQRVFDWD